MKKKVISFLTSVILLGSIVVLPTNAAYQTSDGLQPAEFAGETMKCKIVIADFEGNITESYSVDIPIPATATKARQNQLVQAAVRANEPFEEISYEDGKWTITPNYEPWVGGGRLADNYKTLLVEFEDLTVYNGAQEIAVRMTNSGQLGRNFELNADIRGYDAFAAYIAGGNYGSPDLTLERGDVIDVYASAVSGGVSIGGCRVSASVADISVG